MPYLEITFNTFFMSEMINVASFIKKSLMQEKMNRLQTVVGRPTAESIKEGNFIIAVVLSDSVSFPNSKFNPEHKHLKLLPIKANFQLQGSKGTGDFDKHGDEAREKFTFTEKDCASLVLMSNTIRSAFAEAKDKILEENGGVSPECYVVAFSLCQRIGKKGAAKDKKYIAHEYMIVKGLQFSEVEEFTNEVYAELKEAFNLQ